MDLAVFPLLSRRYPRSLRVTPVQCAQLCARPGWGVYMRAKITKAAVDALQAGAMLADTEVKGFVARRLPSGVVTYGMRYRVAGRQRWLALGIHGRITPDKARRLAKQRMGEVAADRDPAGER